MYDGDNHLILVTDALGKNTTYTYDRAGYVLSMTDGNGNTTTYTYNAVNLLKTKSALIGNDTSGKTESYTYQADGKMASKTDGNGITTSYSYNILGKTVKEDASGEIKSYTYDSNGNLLTMTDDSGTTERMYDALNRTVSKTVPHIGRSAYEYDLTDEEAGNYKERTTDPLGNVTVKTYDKAARLSKVTIGEETSSYSYYPNGNKKQLTYPDGTTEVYQYNRNNQVTSLINAAKAGSKISGYAYTYDAAGNQLTKSEGKGTTTYTYDTLNRLSTVTEPQGRITSYTYDGAGNRKSEKVDNGQNSVTTIYTYNEQNQLISTISSDKKKTVYMYDKNGNLVSKTIWTGTPIKEDIKNTEEKTNTEDKTNTEEKTEANDLSNFDLIIRKTSDLGTGSKDIPYIPITALTS